MIDRFGKQWNFILGEVEVQGIGGPYTLMVGFPMLDCGPYLRLWKDGRLIYSGYISDWQHISSLDRTVVDKCLEYTYRLEKLKAFA